MNKLIYPTDTKWASLFRHFLQVKYNTTAMISSNKIQYIHDTEGYNYFTLPLIPASGATLLIHRARFVSTPILHFLKSCTNHYCLCPLQDIVYKIQYTVWNMNTAHALLCVVVIYQPGAPLLTWFNINLSMDTNHIRSKEWNEITYPFLNFNSCTIDDCE